MKKAIRERVQRNLRIRRTRAKIKGTSDLPRLSVFRSNKYTTAQIIDKMKHATIVGLSTRGMAAKGKKKSELAYEMGLALAEKAKAKGVQKVVFDRAHYKFHGRVKAVAEGARKGGLQF